MGWENRNLFLRPGPRRTLAFAAAANSDEGLLELTLLPWAKPLETSPVQGRQGSLGPLR